MRLCQYVFLRQPSIRKQHTMKETATGTAFPCPYRETRSWNLKDRLSSGEWNHLYYRLSRHCVQIDYSLSVISWWRICATSEPVNELSTSIFGNLILTSFHTYSVLSTYSQSFMISCSKENLLVVIGLPFLSLLVLTVFHYTPEYINRWLTKILLRIWRNVENNKKSLA